MTVAAWCVKVLLVKGLWLYLQVLTLPAVDRHCPTFLT